MMDSAQPGANAGASRLSLRDGVRRSASIVYVLGLALLTLVLLLSRTDLTQPLDDVWLLLLFVVLSVLCGRLSFSIGPDITADLGNLFNGTAVLTLGFNGVWVPLLANLYAVWVQYRRQWDPGPARNILANALMNLTLNTLPPWLGLFVYHDALGGALPLADLGANLAPALAFVLVEWVTLLAALSFPLLLAFGRVSDAAQWFKGVLAGFALSFFVPSLFSVGVAVILNQLGAGFFLFITAGLLGISLMAQRLARSLAAERRRVEELSALNALSDDILHNPPGSVATGELLVRHAPRFMPDADFELSLFDAQEPERRQVAARWRDGAPQPATEAAVTRLWAWLRERRQPLHVADVTQRPLPFTWEPQDHGPRPSALLLVPLLATDPANPDEERCLGGILLTHRLRNAFDRALPSVTALANQLAAALENARLYEAALARERLERELALARGIQTSFLPAQVPQVEGWSFVASLEPARQVSGDFYDFIPLPGERWGVLIADVADKGMPAALYMALVRTLIRAHAPEHPEDPAVCLQAVNDQILSDTQADSFVTVFYGILNAASGEMVFTNAGHNPPWLCRRDANGATAKPTPLRTAGMPLGILPGVELGTARAEFAPGDFLVLYTDGVTEAQDGEHNEFGDERLLAEIRRQDGGSVTALHRCIQVAIQEFVGEAPQSDDLTLMVVGRESS